MGSSTEMVSPWLYFLAGTVVSTITLKFLHNNSNSSIPRTSKNRTRTADDSDSDDDDDDDLIRASVSGISNSKEWGMRHAPYKMVFVVNMSLGMGKGKIAAQCCHAAVGAYKQAMNQCPNAVKSWERTGCAKIAVKAPPTDFQEEMDNIIGAALAKGIPLYLVEDAGRTQIAAGSRTVLGMGPAPVSVFEGVTSHLKLM